MTLEHFKMFALATAVAVAAPTAAAGQQVLPSTVAMPVVSLPTVGTVAAIYDQFKL